MARQLATAVVTEIDATQKKPRLLFEFELTGVTLRYAADKSDITFPGGSGTSYTAKTIILDSVATDAEGQIGRVSIQVDNTAMDMAAYINTYDFDRHTLTIKRIYLDSSKAAPADRHHYVEVFRGTMEVPGDIGRNWVQITATAGKPLDRQALLGTYNRTCRHPFGGAACNADGNADLTTLAWGGTADSGTVTTLVASALTQVDDYWNNGKIQMIVNGTTYKRIVKDFDAATDTVTFDIALPEAVDGATTYSVYKGCDKSWATCGDTYAWGPSADNTANFGGFMHIAQQDLG